MIKYLDHSIMEVTNIQTNKKLHELSYWYTSDESPQIAGRRIEGYFDTRKEAEEYHNKKLVDGLLK